MGRVSLFSVATGTMAASNVVKICIVLTLTCTVSCHLYPYLNQQDFELARTINFRELANKYEENNVTVEFKEPLFEGVSQKGIWRIWPKGIIPYVINEGFSENDRAGIASAIAYMESHTCLRFKPWKDGQKKLPKMTFQPRQEWGFCSTRWRTDGRGGTSATVYLSPNSVCTMGRTIVHEMVHGLAGFHTHKRHDRDSHIIVQWQNISPKKTGQFEICKGNHCDTWGYPYDCDSVMHYAKNQMSNNRKDTIVAKNPAECRLLNFKEWQVHNPYLSPLDIELIQQQYGKFC